MRQFRETLTGVGPGPVAFQWMESEARQIKLLRRSGGVQSVQNDPGLFQPIWPDASLIIISPISSQGTALECAEHLLSPSRLASASGISDRSSAHARTHELPSCNAPSDRLPTAVLQPLPLPAP